LIRIPPKSISNIELLPHSFKDKNKKIKNL